MSTSVRHVYVNLAKGGYSLLDPAARKVVGHAARVLVRDAELRVLAGGHAKVHREGKRNVHAYVVGRVAPPGEVMRGPWVRFRYNPFKFSTFVLADTLAPVYRAKAVMLDEEGAWLIPHPDDAAPSSAPTTRRNPVEAPPYGEQAWWNGRPVRDNPKGVALPTGLGRDARGDYDHDAGPRVAREYGAICMEVASEIGRDLDHVHLGRGAEATLATLPVLARVVRGLYAIRFMHAAAVEAKYHHNNVSPGSLQRRRLGKLRAAYEAAARAFEAFARREAAKLARDRAASLAEADGRMIAALRAFAPPVAVGSLASVRLGLQTASGHFRTARDTGDAIRLAQGVVAIKHPLRLYYDAVAAPYPALGKRLAASINDHVAIA